MNRRVIAFDLDDTLAESKSPVTKTMAQLLDHLLEKVPVCVISGGTFEQFQKQLLDHLAASPDELASLHLMPTCGTRYLRFDRAAANWHEVYAEDLTPEQRKQITTSLEAKADALGYRGSKLWGAQIEDRGTQVTFSALGQDAPLEEKKAWDPDGAKKKALRDLVARDLPEFEVHIGGTTSVDVTRPGVDKAYGIRKLIEQLGLTKKDVLFLGDRLGPDGNDHPVRAMGIDSIAVTGWRDTALAIKAILAVS